ncbi:hypothetical protein DY000_02020208 [Brassica cretica]|uniref:Uncharacterized protein n=2 Tax=Brassica cretica TaxID=69181 RepID=A0ABQ7EDG9_BRACR|nr:hypothetical protein DY000_02020208 [Brassica cretica]
MNFELPNLFKARLLKLSDDLASTWSRTVRENLPSEHEDCTGRVLLLTAGRAVGYIESGHGVKPWISSIILVTFDFGSKRFCQITTPEERFTYLTNYKGKLAGLSLLVQYEDQNVQNNATEVQSIDRTGQTDRAVYRLDPNTSRLELQHNPRDQMTKSTILKLAFPVLFAMLSPSVKPKLKLVEWNPNPTVASLS